MVDFRKMRDTRDLHLFIGCGEALAKRILDCPDDELLDRHFIPKRGKAGGVREVFEIRDRDVADVYKGLSRRLQVFFARTLDGFPHPGAHGYVPGRSTLTNAAAHIPARQVLKADIRDFFRSISSARVQALLVGVGLAPAAAEALSAVLARGNHLPLGFHTSPTVANAVCHALDGRLAALAPGGRYTRYGDDLTFSGPQLPTKEAVAAELAKDGFALADEKWKLITRGRGLYVTGLALEDGRRPRAPRSWKRRLRQDLHYAAKLGLERHIGRRGYPSVQSGVNKIHGQLQYLRGIEPGLGLRLHEQWTRVLEDSGYAPTFGSVDAVFERQVVFLVDESVIDGPPGHRVMALCLAVVEDPDLVRAALASFLSDRAADPYGPTSDDDLRDDGLHWNALAPDDRTRATESIRALPFRAFVAFARIGAEDRQTYEATYLRLLGTIMHDRLIRYDGSDMTVVVEENAKVAAVAVKREIAASYETLAARGARRPKASPACSVVAKGADAALPLPDLLLGIFGEYARVALRAAQEAGDAKKRVAGAQAERRFDQVRDRIRAIYDCDRGLVFSRRRPFEPWEGDGRKRPGAATSSR